MKDFIAVVSHDGEAITKFQDFDTQAEADAHVDSFGGFAVATPGTHIKYCVVDGAAKTVSYDGDQQTTDALESIWAALRLDRDALLVSSDWTQASDSPLTDEVKAEWTVYREELRDLPESVEDPADPTWPTPPE